MEEYRVKPSRKAALARIGRVLAVFGLAAATSVTVAPAPAHAATILNVTHSITIPNQIRHQIDVHLPMNRWDAQGYLNNGARIEVGCWGADLIDDDRIPDCPASGFTGTVTYFVNSPGVFADDTGVHLIIVNFFDVGNQLNEDPADRDEIYVHARWIDADGGTLNTISSQLKGWY